MSQPLRWLEVMFKQVEKERRDDIAVLYWAIWKTRNELVWTDKQSTVAGVVFLAKSTLSSWCNAQDKLLVPTAAFLTEEDRGETWKKPTANKLKVNIDAAIFDTNATYSFVCVDRDANGQLVEAITRCRAGNIAPELAKAMGVREALSWIKQRDWQGTVVETDCLSVFKQLEVIFLCCHIFESIIFNCKMFLEQLRDVFVIFVRRSANRVVYSLARASYFVADRTLMSNEVSTDLLLVIMNDCS
ncbi:hypothetical protein CsatB_027322 [Cannabis sativa]